MYILEILASFLYFLIYNRHSNSPNFTYLPDLFEKSASYNVGKTRMLAITNIQSRLAIVFK